MRFIATVSTLAVIAGTLAAAAVPAYAQSCHELWTERNSYYKARGYCFKTDRAINYFGNAGCIYQNEGDIPFTQGEQNQIQHIRAQEKALEQQVTALRSALDQCKGMAKRWTEVRLEVMAIIAVVFMGLGFALGVYR